MDKLDSNEAQVFTLVRIKGFLRFGLCGLTVASYHFESRCSFFGPVVAS